MEERIIASRFYGHGNVSRFGLEDIEIAVLHSVFLDIISAFFQGKRFFGVRLHRDSTLGGVPIDLADEGLHLYIVLKNKQRIT